MEAGGRLGLGAEGIVQQRLWGIDWAQTLAPVPEWGGDGVPLDPTGAVAGPVTTMLGEPCPGSS